MQDALGLLRPHGDHVGVGGVLGQLQSIADDGGSDEEISKAFLGLESVRARIAKGEIAAEPDVRDHVEKARRALGHEYLCKHSQGHLNAVENAERWRREYNLLPVA